MIRREVSTVLLALALMFSTAAFAGENPKEPKDSKAGKVLKIGDKAPDFTLEDADGKKVSLSDYKGKVVVLEWFNPACPYVKKHYPGKGTTMLDLAKKSSKKKVVWLAINSTRDTDNAANKKASAKWGMTYPVLNDSAGKIGRTYGAKTTPDMRIIDVNGKLAYIGAIDDNPKTQVKADAINYVDKGLAELLAGNAVTTPKTKPYGCSVKYKK